MRGTVQPVRPSRGPKGFYSPRFAIAATASLACCSSQAVTIAGTLAFAVRILHLMWVAG
jgi:hypothetical protein